MSITYNFTVTRVGSSDSFNVGATVTDDTRCDGHQVEHVSVSGKLGTPEQKQGAWDGIRAEYLRKVGEDDIISALEIEGKGYLEAL